LSNYIQIEIETIDLVAWYSGSDHQCVLSQRRW